MKISIIDTGSANLNSVVQAFKRIGDISVEMMDVAVEFHDNIPRPTTPRTFR